MAPLPPGSGQPRTGQFSLLYGNRVTHGSGVSHTILTLGQSILCVRFSVFRYTRFLFQDWGGIVPDKVSHILIRALLWMSCHFGAAGHVVSEGGVCPDPLSVCAGRRENTPARLHIQHTRDASRSTASGSPWMFSVCALMAML